MSQGKDSDRVEETKSKYGEQDEWGNDIASLRANLKLTPLVRLRRAEQTIRFLEKYRGAARRQSNRV